MKPENDEFLRLLVNSGWNQSRAASELELDSGTVSRYVKGEIVPSKTVLKLFASVLNEPLLLPGKSPSICRDKGVFDLDEISLISALRKLPETERRAFMRAFAAAIDSIKPSAKTTYATIP